MFGRDLATKLVCMAIDAMIEGEADEVDACPSTVFRELTS